MIMDFIPVNEEEARIFEEKMSKNVLFRSTDNFIAIYNNNLINKNNDKIDSIAKEVVEVYKNVTLVARQFIVKTKEEVISDEFEVLFPHISFVATLKRIAQNILSENYPEDVKFVFTESDANLVQIYDPSTDEVVAYEGAERLRNANKAIATNPFINANVRLEGFGEDGISFRVMDILQLDTSFITKIGELLDAYVK
jgi:hypothetical protein